MLIKHLFNGAGDKTSICALKNTVTQLLIFAKFALGTEGKNSAEPKKIMKNDKISVKFIAAATECFWILALGNLVQHEQKKKQTILIGSRGTWRPESLPWWRILLHCSCCKCQFFLFHTCYFMIFHSVTPARHTQDNRQALK